MANEEKHHHFLSAHNLFWYGIISASIIFSTGLHKKILSHPVIDEKAIYMFSNDKESIYCDLRDSELPWRFTQNIECKSTIPESENIREISLDRYPKIVKAGR